MLITVYCKLSYQFWTAGLDSGSAISCRRVLSSSIGCTPRSSITLNRKSKHRNHVFVYQKYSISHSSHKRAVLLEHWERSVRGRSARFLYVNQNKQIQIPISATSWRAIAFGVGEPAVAAESRVARAASASARIEWIASASDQREANCSKGPLSASAPPDVLVCLSRELVASVLDDRQRFNRRE